MIRFDAVVKQYPGAKRPALDGVDVEILPGEFVFLVGSSGSGKSSFLRLILREDRPTSGSIHVLGHDLSSISNRKVPFFRRNLGVVFQDFRLLPNKTVFDNVAFTLRVIGKSRGYIQTAVPDTLALVGLAEKAKNYPHELSGGEQQRVAIARAIVNKPKLLLADEPTGNLDPATSAGIMALLERINANGTTIVMSTHEAGIVNQMRRRVIELGGGKLLRDEREGIYRVGGAAEAASQQAPTGVMESVMETKQVLYREPEFDDEVTRAADLITRAATAPVAIIPADPNPRLGAAGASPEGPGSSTDSSSQPDSQATEQQPEPSIAERLGLRDAQAQHDDDQEVGPTQ